MTAPTETVDLARLVAAYRDAYRLQRIGSSASYETRNLAWYGVKDRTANAIASMTVHGCQPNATDLAVWKLLDAELRKRFLAKLEAERAS